MAKTIEQQINADAAEYLKMITAKFKEFNPPRKHPFTPITSDLGDMFMLANKILNPHDTYTVKLSRLAIAYLYKKIYDSTVGKGKQIDGDLAVGFANYSAGAFPNPSNPGATDPHWDPRKADKSTVMLGFWDENKPARIAPFTEELNLSGNKYMLSYYDDWSEIWP